MGHSAGSVGDQPHTPVAAGAVRLVVGRHGGVVEVLRAGEQHLPIDDHPLAVLVVVPVVDVGRVIGVHEVDLPACVLDLLANPLLLVGDATHRLAFEEHCDRHTRVGCHPGDDGVGQMSVLEGVALVIDALGSLVDFSQDGLVDVVWGNSVGDCRRFGKGGGEKVPFQVPAGIHHFLAVDVVVGRLCPVGGSVGVGHRQSGSLVQLAIEDLPLDPEVSLGVRFYTGTRPAGAGCIGGLVDDGVHNSAAVVL